MPLPSVLDSFNPLVRHWRYGERSLPLKLLQAARKRFWYTSEKRVYVYPDEEIGLLPHPRLMRRDHFEDLDYY